MLPIQLNYILIQKSAFNFGSHPNPTLYDSSKIFRGWLSHSVLDIPNVKTKVTTEPQEEQEATDMKKYKCKHKWKMVASDGNDEDDNK